MFSRPATFRVSSPPSSALAVNTRQALVQRAQSAIEAYQRKGQAEQSARPGETVTFPPGDAHRFWNAGDEELVCTGIIRPPDNVEYFLAEIFASIKRHSGKRPGIFDAAYLSHRYRSEFEILEAPTPVRRLVFRVIVAVGKLLGLHRRFAGAPEPVRRPSP